ncbi:MAG: DevR family CRISPR-associated autoregulator [Candidatus Bathyarchaeota archaeon]|nr:DevR family CRISPR-associated autoregulator [Candidatus Bathyarchaeota archaeon]
MLVNVEALNMVESVGNVVRHRTVPIIVRKNSGQYIMRWVPAISGECLAHAYQSFLADLAQKRGINVCYWCARNEFIKHFDLNFYNLTKNKISYSLEENKFITYLNKENLTLDDVRDIEELIVKCCAVEDIGGFLTTQGPTKRTARFYVSYAIPTYDTVKEGIVALDHQFMVRHAPEAELRRGEFKQNKQNQIPAAQAPYYPQVGSALYAWVFNLDLGGIGVSSVAGHEILTADEMKCRRELSLDALAEMLDSKLFGAKLTRFMPFIEFEAVLAAISGGVKFAVSSPTLALEDFIKDTVERAEKAKQDVKEAEISLLAWCRDTTVEEEIKKAAQGKAKVLKTSSIRDLFSEIKKQVVR